MSKIIKSRVIVTTKDDLDIVIDVALKLQNSIDNLCDTKIGDSMSLNTWIRLGDRANELLEELFKTKRELMHGTNH